MIVRVSTRVGNALIYVGEQAYLLGLDRILLHARGVIDLSVVLAHAEIFALMERVLDHKIKIAQLQVL